MILMKRLLVSVVLFLGLFPNMVLAKFGDNGLVTTDFGGHDILNSLALQEDGRIVAAGSGDGNFGLARYTSEGMLDVSFGTGGCVKTATGANITSISLQTDAKIVVVGSITVGKPPVTTYYLARYSNDGSLDAGFGSAGFVTLDFVGVHVFAQTDGKILIGGGSAGTFTVARYLSTGVLDGSFGTAGKTSVSFAGTGAVATLALQTDSKIIAAGGSGGSFALFRLTSAGALDTAFGSGGKVSTDFGGNGGVTNLFIQTDGNIVAAGNSVSSFALARYLSNGTLDNTYGIGGKVITNGGGVSAVVRQSDGKYVTVGSYNDDFMITRYLTDGNFDTTFGTGGKVSTDFFGGYDTGLALVIQPDGKVVAGGYRFNGMIGSGHVNDCDFALARYLRDGGLQVNNPIALEVIPQKGTAGQTLSLDIRGSEMTGLTGIQLRKGSESVNASSINLSDTRITAQFVLPQTPGLYDLYLTKNSSSWTFRSVFSVYPKIIQPVSWIVESLGKAGNPVQGAAGIAVGDTDGDNKAEIFIANGDTQIHRCVKNSAWTMTVLPAESVGYFSDVLLADIDMDGTQEVYGASSCPRVFKYKWSGSNWVGNSFCAYSGPLMKGVQAGGGLAELYSTNGIYLGRSESVDGEWLNARHYRGGSNVICSVSGDLDNDLQNEAYLASVGYGISKVNYPSDSGTNVFLGDKDMTYLCVGDLTGDGVDELYGSDLGGKIHQLKWNGTALQEQVVAAVQASKIAIGDGDNDGRNELYAVGGNGSLYKIKCPDGTYTTEEVGKVGTALTAVAIGDGDTDGQFEVYAADANGYVYQFKALSVIPPTPTVTIQIAPPPDRSFKVYRNQVNPSRGESALVRWSQPYEAPVTITVYNMVGDKIITLADHQVFGAGQFHEVSWNGHNGAGQTVGSGIYIIHIKTDKYETYGKCAIIK